MSATHFSAIRSNTETTAETTDEAAERLGRGLFPHQVEGVAFLLGRRRAILADDMGLGKTRQAIVALTHAAPDGPWLVVCPASVKRNWVREIALAVPGAEAAVVGPESPPAVGYSGWVVINYDILKRHVDALLAHGFAGVIFDEAHYLKNQSSQRSRLGAQLVDSTASDAPVYVLTGTPLTNRPRDLYPLLKVIAHPLGRSFLTFAKRYCAAYNNGFGWVTDGASNLEELTVEIRGSLLRRVKEEVLDLPPKLRSWLEVEVPEGTAAVEIREVVLELTRSRARQSVGRPGQELEGQAGAAAPDRARLVAKLTTARRKLAEAKVRAAIDLVDGAVAQGEKVLVFSCFDAPVQRITRHFGERAVSITGKTPATKRQAIVDRFQEDDEVRVLVANILAGGVGLNLTAARHVVFNDLDWVPANHWQAEDRAYRIGQTETVNVHYLVGAGTIDEFVRSVLEAKAKLAAAVIDGKALEAGTGDVLRELEGLLRSLSPGLASIGEAELSKEDLNDLVREAAARYRSEQGLDDANGPDAGATSKVTEAALAALARALSGPKPTRYRVTSNSKPGAYYEIEVVEGDALCSCPGFEYRGTCSHARKLKAALGGGRALPAGYSVAGVSS